MGDGDDTAAFATEPLGPHSAFAASKLQAPTGNK